MAYQHPPLARIAMAFEPYLAEAHPRGYEGMAEEGREFDARPSGHFALLLARLLGRVVARQKAV